MCYAVQGDRPLWKNTHVTVKDIRAVFRRSPCLTCVLAKKRKEGMAQWKPRKKYKRLRIGKEQSDTKDRKPSTKEEMDQQDDEDSKRYKPGELLSCDNVGPINPKSFEGYKQAFIWRDTCSKRMFSHSDSNASEEVYLEGLENIRLYYKKHGIRIKVIRSDDYTTFKSRKVLDYYAKHGIERQSSTPYQHWQNSVERDIQTMIHNISAVVHGSILMRADSWNRAIKHWIKVHNDLPRSAHQYSPNAIMDNNHQVDAKYQYRFAFGDIVCYPLAEKERRHKFDTKNELGLYLGDKTGMKGGCHVYQPYWHRILTRGDVHRIRISEVELMEWYGKRAYVRQSGLAWGLVEKAMLDLLKSKPYMHSNAPRPAEEDTDDDEPPGLTEDDPESESSEDDSQVHAMDDSDHDYDDESEDGEAPPLVDDSDGESDNESEAPPLVEDSDDESDDGSEPLGEGPDNESDDGMAIDDEPSVPTPEQHARRPRTHPNTIILPVETRPVEELRAGERRTSSRKSKRPAYYIDETYSEGETTWEENGELVRGINVIEQINAHMQSDDNDNEARIANQYHMLTMHDPEVLTVPEEENNENISTRDALRAPDAEQFKEAIRKEIHDLTKGTGTLVPISDDEVKSLKKYWQIGTTLKCKRKKKGNGLPDKHKARGAARGDQLAAKILKEGLPMPQTFSPTVKPLTFALMMQIAVTLGCIWCTADIKSAYLNVPRPPGEIPILTKLESFVAEICDLPLHQLHRIEKCLYGLPDSGRHFYRHYRDALIAEGYVMSKMDNCLFYRVTDVETTFILLFVDDTLIFSKRQEDIDKFAERLNRHYELTLDPKADSFLGINIEHCDDGTVELTQPKLLQKLFKEHPEKVGKRKARTPTHPYGPAPAHNATKQDTPAIAVTTYLRLLGLLMYLTKSRPDIMPAVSFGATKSTAPTEDDYLQLYYIVEYLRATATKGHRIYIGKDAYIQLYCEVDASYLIHSDSKGHTGYTIGLHPNGTFYNRSAKQTLVSTSSTHAEMRALYTLVKDILFIIYVCSELNIPLKLPAVIMEDNSAVVTVSNEESAYLKKCKHFIMVVNYVREQLELGLIQVLKIKGEVNNADLHTKKLRDKSFATKADNILGSPARNIAKTEADSESEY